MTPIARRRYSKHEAIERLDRQVEEAERLKTVSRRSEDFTKWHRDTEVLIEYLFGTSSRHIDDFKEVRYSRQAWILGETADAEWQEAYVDGLGTAQQVLKSMITEVEDYWIDQESDEEVQDLAPISRVERLCDRFHLVARQLRVRHENRSTIDVNDEYDVQDLLHALLMIDFEDVRREEWSPSYAGSGSRFDFLLTDSGIVIEIKKTRRGLTDRQVGEHLIIDRARYEQHPLCRFLVCFVYDPEGRIGNPRGLENDFGRREHGLPTRVIIAPRS